MGVRGTDEYSREVMATGGLWMAVAQARGVTAEPVEGEDGQVTPRLIITFEHTLGELLGHRYLVTIVEIPEDEED